MIYTYILLFLMNVYGHPMGTIAHGQSTRSPRKPTGGPRATHRHSMGSHTTALDRTAVRFLHNKVCTELHRSTVTQLTNRDKVFLVIRPLKPTYFLPCGYVEVCFYRRGFPNRTTPYDFKPQRTTPYEKRNKKNIFHTAPNDPQINPGIRTVYHSIQLLSLLQ